MDQKNIKRFTSIDYLEKVVNCKRSVLRDIYYNKDKYYYSFDREGKNRWRHIDAPKKGLRKIQEYILKDILSKYNLPYNIYGGVKKKNHIKHARLHLQKKTLVTIDIKNFFHSIISENVYNIFSNKLNCGSKVTKLLTGICTLDNHLPQGAPTSTMIANIYIAESIRQINILCKKRGYNFSIYIDDMAISGDTPEDLVNDIISILINKQLSFSHEKIKIMKTNKEITGLQLRNGSLKVSDKYINEIETDISLHKELGIINQYDLRSLDGKINYVKTLNQSEAQKLKQLLSSITVLHIGSDQREEFYKKCDGNNCKDKYSKLDYKIRE